MTTIGRDKLRHSLLLVQTGMNQRQFGLGLKFPVHTSSIFSIVTPVDIGNGKPDCQAAKNMAKY